MSKLKPPFVRSPYNYDVDAASDEAGLFCPEPTLAQQHLKDECDINNILERFGITGELPVAAIAASYGDFSGVGDYHSLLNQIKRADEAFYALPADLRSQFANDPGRLIDFCNDPNNREKAIELGLIDAVEPQVVVSKEETPKADVE